MSKEISRSRFSLELLESGAEIGHCSFTFKVDVTGCFGLSFAGLAQHCMVELVNRELKDFYDTWFDEFKLKHHSYAFSSVLPESDPDTEVQP